MSVLTKNSEQAICILHFLWFGCQLPKTKIMVFDHNKRKLNQETYYLGEDQIEMSHEYKYLGIDFYSQDYFELHNIIQPCGLVP